MGKCLIVRKGGGGPSSEVGIALNSTGTDISAYLGKTLVVDASASNATGGWATSYAYSRTQGYSVATGWVNLAQANCGGSGSDVMIHQHALAVILNNPYTSIRYYRAGYGGRYQGYGNSAKVIL